MTNRQAPRRPTIGDVAGLVGVSRATVSRAFGRPDKLSPATVARIQQAAEEIGYVPNRVAQALSTGRQGSIAVIVPDIANPFFPPIIRAVQARAEDAELSVVLGDSAEATQREAQLVQRLTAQVDGFVLASSRLPVARIREVAAARPTVLINRDVRGIARVLIDTGTGVSAAVAHLARLGHRHIAYVGGPADSWSDQQRRHAAQTATGRLGIGLTVVDGNAATYDAGGASAQAVVAAGATAVIAFDDVVAHGLLAGLHALGLSVPEQVSVVGCDDILAPLTYPPLTTISAPCAEAGRVAVECLLSSIDDEPPRRTRRVLDARLVVRATTAPPPTRGRLSQAAQRGARRTS